MTRFRIDSPDIDIEVLQRRVEEAVERKRGQRFTDEELERLRQTPLRPRMRREDLPRGMVDAMREARARLPEVPPSPSPEPLDRGELPSPAGEMRPRPDLSSTLYGTDRDGLSGRVLRWVRRLLRPLFRLGPNVESALSEAVDWLAERDDRTRDALQDRLDRSVDALKVDGDRRADRAADWAGDHLTELGGALEVRHERQLHLFHNLVYELTNARLDLERMQDRINELTRRVETVQAREQALESLVLPKEEDGTSVAPSAPGD